MKKITPDIDIKIMEALACGESNKNIAKTYGVSPSYVSKIKTGKKVPYIHVASPTLIKDEYFDIYSKNLVELEEILNETELIVNRSDIVEYLEVQMRKCLIKAKMYNEILKRYRNGK